MYVAVTLSALALLGSVASFFYFRAYLRRRTGQERILSELREEVNSIVRSIDETTDRDISLIEERGKSLRALLEDVDKRLRVYVRELEKRREDEVIHLSLAERAPTPTYEELGKNRYHPHRQSLSPAPPPATQSAPVASALLAPADPVAAQPPPESAPPPVGGQIRELVRAGLSPQVIASRLGLSIAEVEVVAALMERREA